MTGLAEQPGRKLPATKKLLAAVEGADVASPPVWLMRQAGRYLPEYREVRARAGTFLDLCFTPALAAEVTLQPVRRFDLDGAIIFSDILVIPHALGQKVRYEEGRGPVLEAIRDGAALAKLESGHVRDRLGPTYEAIARVTEELPEGCAMIGFAGAPWTVATYMIEGGTSRDFVEAKRWAFADPDGFQTLIDLLVEETVDHLVAQVEAGAEVVQIFDSWAGALPEAAFQRWSVAPIAEIAGRVKQRCPDVKIIAFPRGAGLGYRDIAAIAAVDAVSLDSTVPLGWARETLQPRVAAQGNLDPVLLVAGGRALDEGVDAVLAALGGGRFVFNLGHGVLPMTPPENVARLVARVRAGGG